MNLRSIVISIVLFSTFIVASSLMMSDLSTKYSTPYDGSWNGTYDKVNEISEDMNTAQASLSASGTSPVGFIDFISTGAYQTAKITLNSGSLIKTMSEDFANRYNIPPIFVNSFITICLITLIFGIASAIFRIPL